MSIYPLFESARNETYQELIRSGRLTKMEVKVFEAVVELGRATAEELVKHTGIPINSISGRCRGLRDKEAIVICDHVKNPATGMPNSVYCAK